MSDRYIKIIENHGGVKEEIEKYEKFWDITSTNIIENKNVWKLLNFYKLSKVIKSHKTENPTEFERKFLANLSRISGDIEVFLRYIMENKFESAVWEKVLSFTEFNTVVTEIVDNKIDESSILEMIDIINEA